ncbi:MAG: 1,2-phenylacetyl-CoA epoxidase subunit PaaC, partial [Anaerolineales bacterium]|nr:1,2-phenylacetyl-CoA epoxidase subunit PaaC [Anaerolineales bacterium]
EFRNCQLVERPVGDWAFTILRQFLFDLWEKNLLEGLIESRYTPVSEVAAKIAKEEVYHLRHSRAWVIRLGLGTKESNIRMQRALDQQWQYALQLTQPIHDEALLAEAGFYPSIGVISDHWTAQAGELFEQSDLKIPAGTAMPPWDRSVHTASHETMILEMQSVVRQYPDAGW